MWEWMEYDDIDEHVEVEIICKECIEKLIDKVDELDECLF